MDLYDVMRTTFAARQFTDKAIDDSTIRRILENARFAPSGGNRQGWHVIVVRDPSTRKELKDILRPGMQRYFAQVQAGEAPWNTIHPTRLSQDEIDAVEVADPMVEVFTHAPVLVFVFVDLSVVASFDRDLDRVGVISGASIYPFVWNILLAARNEGLGGTPTTFAGARERDLQELLGVPRHIAFASMIILGEPTKQLTKLKRKPVDEFAVLERFGGLPSGSRPRPRHGGSVSRSSTKPPKFPSIPFWKKRRGWRPTRTPGRGWCCRSSSLGFRCPPTAERALSDVPKEAGPPTRPGPRAS